MATTTPAIDFSNIDYLTLFATIFIAAVGWIVALVLQRSNAKHEHRIQVRYEIYKELLKSTKETQNKLVQLATVSSPFILMDSCMIGFELGLTKDYKGSFIPITEQECLFEGEKKWTKFTQDIYANYFAFINQYNEMLYLFGGWAAAIEPLIKTQTVFTREINILTERVKLAADNLASFTSKHGHDWRKWNKAIAESYVSQIRDDSQTMGSYLHDFAALIHNELLSKYFSYQKPIRKTLDPKYKVLTESGLVERVDTEKLKDMALYKKELIELVNSKLNKILDSNGYISEEYKNYLVSIKQETCPECKNVIEVIETEHDSDHYSFLFTCGHGWKTQKVEEGISL